MIQRSYLRVLFGFCIGAFAGISLATGVAPFVINRLFGLNSFEVMIAVQGFVLPIAIIWAIGGAILGWQGGSSAGGVILGACGAVAGVVIGLFALQAGTPLIIGSILVGVIYGAIGGLIIGYVFPTSLPEAQ